MLGFSKSKFWDVMRGDKLEQTFGGPLLFVDIACVCSRGGKPLASLCQWCFFLGMVRVGKRSSVFTSPAHSTQLRGNWSVKLTHSPSRVRAEFHKCVLLGHKSPERDKRIFHEISFLCWINLGNIRLNKVKEGSSLQGISELLIYCLLWNSYKGLLNSTSWVVVSSLLFGFFHLFSHYS